MLSFFILVLMALVYLAMKPGPYSDFTVENYGPMVLVLTLMSLAAGSVKQWELKRDQDRRDEEAQHRAETSLQAPPPGHDPAPAAPGAEARLDGRAGAGQILYLRPFAADDQVRAVNPRKSSPGSWFVPFMQMSLESQVTLDDALASYLRPFGELVAIGAKGTHVGASQVRVGDERWRDYFAALARNSALILVYLGLRPGTQWEVEFLSTTPELLGKTILLFPQPQRGSKEGLWDIAAIDDYLRSLGLDVPSPTPGEAVLLDARGAIRHRGTVLRHGSVNKRALRAMADLVAPRL